MPHLIFDTVWKANMSFLRSKLLFEREYFLFIAKLAVLPQNLISQNKVFSQHNVFSQNSVFSLSISVFIYLRNNFCNFQQQTFIGPQSLQYKVWYFEEGGMVLWRWWCGTLKRVVWYFEEGGVVLWREWCGTLKRVMWYFEEGGVVLWREWCGTLKRVVWYFE